MFEPNFFTNPSPAGKGWFVKFPLKQCADLFGLPYTGVIDRPDLQEILLDECRKIKPDFIQNGNAVTGYESHGPGKGVDVKLADGRTEHSDLLVGADGIWSSVRAQMYGEEIKGTSGNGKKKQGCTYSGYTVFAGETVMDTPDYYETGYKVYIGPQRYFVTSDVGQVRASSGRFKRASASGAASPSQPALCASDERSERAKGASVIASAMLSQKRLRWLPARCHRCR